MPRSWTAEQRRLVREMAAQGKTDGEIAIEASKHGPERTISAVTQWRTANAVPGGRLVRDGKLPALTRIVNETPERTVRASHDVDEEPIEDLLARSIARTSRAVKKVHALRHAEARIVTRRPIALAFASDQHFSTSEPVDVERAFEDAELIQQTPGMYAILGGDGADNHIKHRSAMVNKRSAPSEEWRLYDHYLRVLGHKILAMVSGNHDDWTKDFAGIDMAGMLATRHKLHYAPDEVCLSVQLTGKPDAEPSQSYVVKLRHQYRFNSTLNVGHTVKRMYDMGGDPFDVGVVCHHHEAHVETFERHGATRWALRPGSYQVQTSYGRRYGFNPAHPTCPVAILWPDERRILCLPDLREGVDYLASVRGGADLKAA